MSYINDFRQRWAACANDLTPDPQMPFAEVEPTEDWVHGPEPQLNVTPADHQSVKVAVDKTTHEIRYEDEDEHSLTLVVAPKESDGRL